MNKMLATAALAVVIAVGQFASATPAVAEEAKKPAAKQQRMKDCNANAKGMKGQERKDFMKQCLSGKQAENQAAREERREERKEVRLERQAERKDGRAAQQEKMKACNADAKTKGLKGDARKAFMSDCLKN